MVNSIRKKQEIWFPTFLLIAFLLFTPILTPSCVTLKDPEASQEFKAHVVAYVQPGESVGQSFISRRSRLNGIELWMRVTDQSSNDGFLQFNLYKNPLDPRPIFQTSIPFLEIEQKFPLYISFPTQFDPPDSNYYLHLTTDDGIVQVLGRQEDTYTNGYLVKNGKSIDADIGFRLTYNYDLTAIVNDISEGISNIWLMIPLFGMLWVPGNLIIKLLNEASGNKIKINHDLGTNIALSTGISIALIPLLFLWTTTLGIRISRNYSYAFFTALLLINIWISRSKIIDFFRRRRFRITLSVCLDIILLKIFLFSLFLRLAMIRDLAAPAWIDSVHHALITQLIVQTGQFPASYSPYLSIATSNYHPGFHSNLAVFHFLSSLDIAHAMLIFGQVLNALCIFASYLFTKTILKNQLAGVIAALITGVITPMPAYYTSWGRYTQLTGILAFSTAIVLILMILENQNIDLGRNPLFQRIRTEWSLFLLAILSVAGLFLTHYRVSIFLGSFFIVYFFASTVYSIFQQNKLKIILIDFFTVGLITCVAFLLSFPWWPETLRTFISPRLFMTGTRIPIFNDFQWRYLNAALGKYATGIAIIGLLWGLIRKRQFAIIFSLWIVLMFFLANMHILPIPGTKLINNTSVEIFLFLPISTLIAYIFTWLIENWNDLIPANFRKGYHLALIFIFSAIAILGAKSLLPILNPVTFLFREADYQALNWIENNIPEEETILVNPFAWGYGLFGGSDGGYWISPLAGRKTIPPPVLYGLEFDSADFDMTQDIIRYVINHHDAPGDLHPFLVEQDIRYIYIGKRGGILSPKLLDESSLFKSIFSSEGTWVFKLEIQDY